MSDRAESLARKVEAANDALVAAIEATTPEQWTALSTNLGWTQGFEAYHAANSVGGITQMVRSMASGEPRPTVNFADIDAMNAVLHREHADCTKEETLALARQHSPSAAAMVRGLTDEQLDRPVKLVNEMPEVPVHQLVEMLLVGHAAGHTDAITRAR